MERPVVAVIKALTPLSLAVMGMMLLMLHGEHSDAALLLIGGALGTTPSAFHSTARR